MQTADALARLFDHQARLLAQIDQAVALLDADPESVRGELARARWTMTRLLREYQIFKHHEIFDPAIVGGDPLRAVTARRIKANCIAAGERYRAHVTHWSSHDVVADWAAYRPSMLAMADALRGHVGQERRDVEALLAGSERTRKLGEGASAA